MLMPLGDRIKVAAQAVGGQRALSAILDISERALSAYVAGTSSPQVALLERIAEATKTDMYWLITGSEPQSGPVAPEFSAAGSEGMVFVPVLDIQASAGPGTIIEQEPVAGVMALRREMVRALGVSSPDALRILEARGNSMEPTIRAGDLLLVDTVIDRVLDEGIYVFRWNGSLVVKRIRITRSNGIELVSDNGGHTEKIPEAELPDLHAAGRVVRVIRAV